MKKLLHIILIIVACSSNVFGQEVSKNNQFNASWEVGSTWQDGTAPAYTNVGNAPTNVNFNIYGYISLGSSVVPRNLTFANNHPTLTFTVYDTLVVFGNMTFGTDAMSLSVPAGGLLIVFGNLDVNNKVDIAAGGNIVVTGEFKLTGAQADVNVTGAGAFYAGSYNNGAQAEVPDNVEFDTGVDLQNNLPWVYQFIQNGGAFPLPIELIFFKASKGLNKIALSWATASELNFDYFDVEKSSDGKAFHSIARVNGHGTTNERKDYALDDEKPYIGKNYYRLKSVDFDGYTEYFNIVLVDFDGSKGFTISPNPFDGLTFTAETNFIPQTHAYIAIYSTLGSEIGRFEVFGDKSQLTMSVKLASGVYYARYISRDFTSTNRVVVK